MLVKYINRIASSASASAINQEYKDFSTPSFDSRTVVRERKQDVDRNRMRLNSTIKQFIRDIILRRKITRFDIYTFNSSISELQTMMSIPDIVSKYSYNSSGGIISGKEFMIRTSKYIFENIINFLIRIPKNYILQMI